VMGDTALSLGCYTLSLSFPPIRPGSTVENGNLPGIITAGARLTSRREARV